MTQPSGFTLQYAIRLPDGTLGINYPTGEVWTSYDRAAAEQVLTNLRTSAAALGVPDWKGSIEHRYCTPFVPLDGVSSEQMLEDLDAWLKQQTGEQQS